MGTEDKTIKLKVTGMSCMGCVNAVKSALESVDGVVGAAVDLDSGFAEVKIGTEGFDPDRLKSMVKTAGYGIDIIG